MRPLVTIGAVYACIMCVVPADAGVRTMRLELVADGLSAPNLLISANDDSGRLFVVDQVGQVRTIDADGALMPTPFVDIADEMVPLGAFGPGSFDERGLLGLAFHPDFTSNGRFFVYYSAPRLPDTTISFGEAAIPNGVSDFDFSGVRFSGGIVGTQFSPPLYCSGSKAFEVAANATATITFSEPVVRVRFFFVHKTTADVGSVTAVLANGSELPAVSSSRATVACDSTNFVTLDDTDFPTIGIRQLRLEAGSGSGRVLFLDDLEVSSFNHQGRISEFQVAADNPNAADPSSEVVILEIDQPQFNHNAGMLAFGPDDGFLYISVGDGGNANDVGPFHNAVTGNGQDLSTLKGKLLRIDVDADEFPTDPRRNYAIPPDNPFGGIDGRDEIWAYGLRNPFRFSFDLEDGHRLFCADVGQDLYEEINIVQRGDNLGWRVREGTHCFDPDFPTDPPLKCADSGARGELLVDPILEYPHTAPANEPNGIAVQGGFVHRSGAFSGLFGRYVFGDWSRGPFGGPADGSIFVAKEDPLGGWDMTEPAISNAKDGRMGRFVLGFGQDDSGNVYVCSSDGFSPNGNGQIHRMVPSQGDADHNGSVDLHDVGTVQTCLSGADGPVAGPVCTGLDVNDDGLVDLTDAIRLIANLTGP